MAEPTEIMFSYKEVAEALVKKHGIHEGIWGLSVNFALQATNVGPNENDLKPAAVVPIVGIGLHRFQKENNLTVDASKVNPKSTSKAKSPPS